MDVEYYTKNIHDEQENDIIISMKFKKLLFSLLILPSLFTSCSKEDEGEAFLKNAECFEGKINQVVEGNIQTVKNLLNLNINFLVYFHKPECYWCDKFQPILDDFLKKSETLVVDVPYDSINAFSMELGSYFFAQESISFPYLAIANGLKQVERVNNTNYMQTKNVFENYMESRIKKSTIYYSYSELQKFENTCEFTHISLQKSSISVLTTFSQKVKNIALNSTKNSIISFEEKDGINLIKYDSNFIEKEKAQILIDTEPSIIENFF